MKNITRIYGMAIAQTMVGILVGSTMLFTYWYNEPPPYTLHDRVILTPRVEQGSEFKLQVKVQWTKNCYSKLFRTIIDADGNLYPFEREVRPSMKGLHTFTIKSNVPKDAAVGPARWEVKIEWYCNPIQNRFPYIDILDPIPFEIVPYGSKNLTKR